MRLNVERHIVEFQFRVDAQNHFQVVPPDGVRDDFGPFRNYTLVNSCLPPQCKDKRTLLLQTNPSIIAHGPNTSDETRTRGKFLHPRHDTDLAC